MMKKLVASLLVLVVITPQLFAPWAAHLVISPASKTPDPKAQFAEEVARRARGVSISAAGKDQVRITLEDVGDQKDASKRYYLITAKKRLAADALNLRSVLGRRKLAMGRDGFFQSVPGPASGFEEIQPLQPSQRNGKGTIEVVLDRQRALRSYVVWDFKVIYEEGAMIMDGGLWLTYDIPAFVEASPSVPSNKQR